MNIKNLAAMTACVAAFGVGVGVAPAAAKNDKNPDSPGNGLAKGKQQYKHCETGTKKFKCLTETGETASGQCPSGDYEVIASITAGIDVDLNADGFVCYSPTLGYVDDKAL